MAEMLEDAQGTLESHTIGIYRTAATVKGGRRFSFGALVAVGDRNGSVGLGYGKAPGVPAAIEKAQKDAKKRMRKVQLNRDTITHDSTGRFCSSKVRLIPASPGTGVIAGGTVRAVLELAGVKDCLTKSYGSNNQINLAKATMEGLVQLRTRETIAELRGVTIDRTVVDEKIELGEKFAPSATAGESGKAKAPVNVMDEKARSSKGGRGRGGKGGGRGRGRGRGRDEESNSGSDSSGDTAVAEKSDESGSDAGEEKKSE
mgnify:CR=1 FL=1